MARPREFCEVTALDRVTQVFWQRGFAATTINDLVEATGLQKQSLYNAFGDKEQLFAKAIDNYRLKAGELSRPLTQCEAGLKELKAYILRNLAYQNDNECGGCMVTRTTMDQHVTDPTVRKLAQESSKRVQALFEQVLVQAQRNGEVRRELNPGDAARLVFAVMNGLSALVSSGIGFDQVEQTLELSFAGLSPGAQQPSPGAQLPSPGA